VVGMHRFLAARWRGSKENQNFKKTVKPLTGLAEEWPDTDQSSAIQASHGYWVKSSEPRPR
jgi:hypothetical protein